MEDIISMSAVSVYGVYYSHSLSSSNDLKQIINETFGQQFIIKRRNVFFTNFNCGSSEKDERLGWLTCLGLFYFLFLGERGPFSSCSPRESRGD